MSYRLGESSSSAVRRIKLDGLELPERPDYEQPTIPQDITSVDPVELMELFAEVNSWLDYTEVQLACAQIDEKYEEQQLEEIQALDQINYKDEKTVTTMKARAFESEDFLAQRERTIKAYGYRKIAETIYNRLERARFIISREITRRTGERNNG